MYQPRPRSCSVHTENQRAFTLVELLITVAIIAILAAIAIPNFLAAQTRAKVSRARADMRTVVTAVETYRVDSNAYPTYHYADVPGGSAALHFHIGGKVPGFGIPDPDWDGRNPLTTPIAYLTRFPLDPFAPKVEGPPEIREFHYVNWRYAFQQVPTRPQFALMERVYGTYRLHSRGPNQVGPESGVPYDPTNGTVSDGDIIYGPNTGFDRFIPLPF